MNLIFTGYPTKAILGKSFTHAENKNSSLVVENFSEDTFISKFHKKLGPCIHNLLYGSTNPAAATAESNHTHLSIDLKQYQHHSHTHYQIVAILAIL